MEKTSEIILNLDGIEPLDLFGINDTKLNALKNAYPDLIITTRGSQVKLNGLKKDAQSAKSKIEMMMRIISRHGDLTVQAVQELVGGGNPIQGKLGKNSKTIVHGRDGRVIKARTKNQKRLVEASTDNDIVFAIGPAGTGKTYVAVAMAVKALRNRLVKKIILTRPAVEAGESLGFLPGDMKDKVDPYLRPLYDALDDLINPERLKQFIANRVIEVAPLAFMRGRTLDNAFVILDEAQNASSVQLKMFLTRLGPNAKCIVTGDLTQIDLPRHQYSGLGKALDLLGNVNGIEIVRMSKDDVVRHRLVKRIIEAYDIDNKKRHEEE